VRSACVIQTQLTTDSTRCGCFGSPSFWKIAWPALHRHHVNIRRRFLYGVLWKKARAVMMTSTIFRSFLDAPFQSNLSALDNILQAGVQVPPNWNEFGSSFWTNLLPHHHHHHHHHLYDLRRHKNIRSKMFSTHRRDHHATSTLSWLTRFVWKHR
jgi:hypothetical protein